MRHRELVARLKDDRQELRLTYGMMFSGLGNTQRKAERRLELLHALENLLPEIIEKLEKKS